VGSTPGTAIGPRQRGPAGCRLPLADANFSDQSLTMRTAPRAALVVSAA
jgi:hypothetical protein